MSPDGDCFFRAFSKAYTGEDHARTIRNAVVLYARLHPLETFDTVRY